MTTAVELLAPAREAQTAIAAIQCGADAVYIGAPSFSARAAAGNSISAIASVVDFAHQYYANVYVAINTLLRDAELPQAQTMISQLYEIDIDGLIIQDVGLLELDLPPIRLIASTQMHNSTPERVKFWQDIGFSRVILARELTLDQIRQIRRQTSVELECFVHGALCVGASGQCYMSYAMGGRSGNRGQCAQPCRRLYSLKDKRGKAIVEDRHLLSLKDLNLAAHLDDLVDAGITSFKIEGRLKDAAYVTNTVAFYRRELDAVLTRRNLRPGSSGSVALEFEPDPNKTFNRGFTDYGLTGHTADIGSIDTPKSMGQFIGTVARVERSHFLLEGPSDLHSADGICFLDEHQDLAGTVVNRVEDRKVYPQKISDIRPGQQIYRNYDHRFTNLLRRGAAQRTIRVSMLLQETPAGLELSCIDEDGNRAAVEIVLEKKPALKRDQAQKTIHTQLTKLGNTPFECTELRFELPEMYFLPVSQLNAARRDLIECLLEVRRAHRSRNQSKIEPNAIPFPERRLTYLGNVLNGHAEAFYRRHGVEQIERAPESGLDLTGRMIMTTKYCLREQLGLCSPGQSKSPAESLILQDEDGRRCELRFRCGPCGMDIFLD